MPRISALPILQYCGRAAELDTGSGRAAAMSTAAHAVFAGAPEARLLLDALTTKERAEVLEYKRPTPLEVFGCSLAYEDFRTEFSVALTDKCELPGLDDEPAFTGHPDMAAVVAIKGRKIAIIGDIKRRGIWTTTEGTDSLQLHGYGLAWALENDCDGWITAIWNAVDGGWTVREEVVWLNSEDWQLVVNKMRSTLLPGNGFATGPHCSGCWSRLRCPAHMVRLDGRDVVPGTSLEELDNDKALEMLQTLKRNEDTNDALRKHLVAWADANDGIRDGYGKVWRAVKTKGRESSLPPKRLREELGEVAEAYITRGADYYQHRWTNDKGDE